MTDDDSVVLTRQELKDLASDVVDDTLVKLGIEPRDHKQMQEDMIFLRKLRSAHESVTKHKIILGFGLIFTITLTLLTMGLKAWLTALVGHGT